MLDFIGQCWYKSAFSVKALTKGDSELNKAELVEHVAGSVDLSKADATRAVDAVIEGITTTLKNRDQVSLVGFGTFLTKERAAREGRNPQTGETIQIAAATVPAFKPGKGLKDIVNAKS